MMMTSAFARVMETLNRLGLDRNPLPRRTRQGRILERLPSPLTVGA